MARSHMREQTPGRPLGWDGSRMGYERTLRFFLGGRYLLRAFLSHATRLPFFCSSLHAFNALESFCTRVNGFGLDGAAVMDAAGATGGGGVAAGNV